MLATRHSLSVEGSTIFHVMAHMLLPWVDGKYPTNEISFLEKNIFKSFLWFTICIGLAHDL